MLNFLRFAFVRGKHLSVFFYSALNTGQKHFLDNFRRTYRKRVTEQIIYVLCYEEIVFFFVFGNFVFPDVARIIKQNSIAKCDPCMNESFWRRAYAPPTLALRTL